MTGFLVAVRRLLVMIGCGKFLPPYDPLLTFLSMNSNPAKYAFVLSAFVTTLAFAADTPPVKPAAPPAKNLQVPTHADVSYGPHPHQLLGVHLPKDGTGPFQVLVWYGGIWQPAKHVPDINRFHPQHIA